VFHVGVHVLSLDIEGIYFLTGLSHRGAHVTLIGGRGGGFLMSEYIHLHCEPKAERRKGKVAIRGVQELNLPTILFTIARMVGSASPHMPSKVISSMLWNAQNLVCSTGAMVFFAI
jgi:hypothetical protein